MAKYPAEMFAHFFYSSDLTYEELHDVEEDLIKNIDMLLEGWGGVHVDFSRKGDALGVQCEFTEFDHEQFAELAKKISPFLGEAVVANIIFIDKGDMTGLCIYRISSHTVENDEIPVERPTFGESCL